MLLVVVSKTFTFEAGHRLSNYAGKCRRLHGHSYILRLTVEGDLNDIGMVIDFGELKRFFNEIVDSKFDHRLILMGYDPFNKALSKALPKDDDSICWVDYNPTAENMVTDIFNMLKDELPTGVRLVGVKLYETPTSYAEISI